MNAITQNEIEAEVLCEGSDHVSAWWLDSGVWHEEPHEQWEQKRSDREHRRVIDQLDRDRARDWAQDVAAQDRWLANQN